MIHGALENLPSFLIRSKEIFFFICREYPSAGCPYDIIISYLPVTRSCSVSTRLLRNPPTFRRIHDVLGREPDRLRPVRILSSMITSIRSALYLSGPGATLRI